MAGVGRVGDGEYAARVNAAVGLAAAGTAPAEAAQVLAGRFGVSVRQARRYVELQLTRARLYGLRCGVGHAIALFPNDPLRFDSLEQLGGAARRF